MPTEIRMPVLAEEAPEGVVVGWRADVGEPVAAGQVVVEVETDKAIVEIEAARAGVLAARLAEVGAVVPAGAVLAVLAGEGEDAEEVARACAQAGTGAASASAGGSATACPDDPHEAGVLKAIPIRGSRRTIATRMLRSYREIPQYHVTVDCDAGALLEARRALKKDRHTRAVGANAILLKCVAAALEHHPMLNATIVGETIYQHARVNIALAVAGPDGVVAPVVKDVAGKSLQEVSAEVDALTEAARRRRLKPEQLRGGTFTVSSLGAYGVRHFTAIIVPPQVAILAVGAVRHEPVLKDGQVSAGRRIALTLSADHRAVDGAVAAEFLRALHGIVEDPAAVLS